MLLPSLKSVLPSLKTRALNPRARQVALAAGLTAVLMASVADPASAGAQHRSRAAAPASTMHKPAARSKLAQWGAGWLSAQITANGGHLDSFGYADPGNTAYAVVGLHAAGVGRTASAEAIAYLKTQLGAPVEYEDGTDNPGLLAYFILAAVSAGENPRRFGGTDRAHDLVARLLATIRTHGADAGLFGTGDPAYDGAFRQGLALAALKAAGVPLWNRHILEASTWLIRQQCANGLWLGYRADRSVACPAADPNTFTGPDTNDTALAVQGLAAYGLFSHRSRTLASLGAVQSADAGFPYLAAPGQTSDPNSTALTIQALLVTGVSISKWKKGAATPIAALASYQLGCSAPAADRGAFFYPGDTSPNVLATVQAVPAAAGVPLSAVHHRPVSRAVPHPSCVAKAATANVTEHPVKALSVSTTLAGSAGRCPGSTGVTVSVDFTAFAQGVQTRCAPGAPATGVAALQQAGFTPAGTQQYGLAFVCRINSLPSTSQQSCVRTPSATAYWAYYHANAGATTWTYSTTGASTYKPAQGSIEAWAFGNGAKPSKSPAQIRAGQ